jgi:hypothetical protein
MKLARFLLAACVLASLASCGGDPEPEGPPAKLEGKLTGVSYIKNLFFIDIGRRDGVKVGDLFVVLEDGAEIAWLRADSVEEDWSGCRELVERRMPGTSMDKGDRVRQK